MIPALLVGLTLTARVTLTGCGITGAVPCDSVRVYVAGLQPGVEHVATRLTREGRCDTLWSGLSSPSGSVAFYRPRGRAWFCVAPVASGVCPGMPVWRY